MFLPVSAAQAAIHNVTQVNLTFQPANITIQLGDTVVWTHTSGSHTVTNGTGGADPNAGTLFDMPLFSSNPTVQFTFNAPGTVPYFCRPHEGFGMKGTIIVEPTVDVPGGSEFHYALMQSAPNPFRNTTKVQYSIAQPEHVELLVFDATGRLARTLIDEYVSKPGAYGATWDGGSNTGQQLPSGVYFYRMKAGEFSATRRMILTR
jgi:plastocyanin